MAKNNKKSKLEIEKRLLLKKLPSIRYDEIQSIIQFYTPSGRYRSIHTLNGVKFIKTVKTPISKGVDREVENEITQQDFNKERRHSTKDIAKTRYIKKMGTLKWEIDVFNDINLTIAEIEVKAKKDLKTVKIPKFISEVLILDITGIKAFKNFNLAEKIESMRK